MVSFKGHSQRRHADYWKIPVISKGCSKRTLRAIVDTPGSKRHYALATTRYRLWELATRTQRGLHCYDGDSTIELKLFISQRSLTSAQVASRVKKSELIDLLESADEKVTFKRFLDLPPELRVLIYEMHFDSYLTFDDGASITSASPPPVTHVNTQIREETLKLFYSTCHFKFDFAKLDGPPAQIMADRTNLLRHLPQGVFSAVRNFCVHVRGFAIDSHEYVECSVRLTAGNAKLSIMYQDRWGHMEDVIPADPQEEEVRRFFAEDFVHVWPPMLTVEVADALFDLARKSAPEKGSDKDDW